MTLNKDEVEFAVSAHQLYNTLQAGHNINAVFAENPFFTPEQRAAWKQQSDYQQHLLEILFKVTK